MTEQLRGPHRPTVFISSTIYDFADLRGALKYWLEELGYRVLTSEFNDFERSVEKNSYEACLDAIRASDWFVLLVGGRRGGWFDQAQRVTITQQEYRTAYELSRAGKLRVVPFVRQKIWDWKEMQADIKRLAAGDSGSLAILDGSTDTVQDPSHLRDFLDEIRRRDEMKQHLAGGVAPTGNWVTTFSTFRDITDTLSVLMRIRWDLSIASLVKLATLELKELLRSFCSGKGDSPGRLYHELLSDVRARYSPTRDFLDEAFVTMPRRTDFEAFFSFALRPTRSWRLEIASLEQLAASGALLEVDRASGTLRVGETQRAVARTVQAARRVLNKQFLDQYGELFAQLGNAAAASVSSDEAEVKPLDILKAYHLSDQMERAAREALNLLGHWEHGLSLEPNPAAEVPPTPLVDDVEGVRRERVSELAVDEAIRSRLHGLRVVAAG